MTGAGHTNFYLARSFNFICILFLPCFFFHAAVLLIVFVFYPGVHVEVPKICCFGTIVILSSTLHA